MEIDAYRAAWQNRPAGDVLPAERFASPSVRFLRASAIRDVEKSEELTQLVFCGLFALVVVGATSVVLSAGGARMASWLLATALLADALAGVFLLVFRFRERGSATMLEFIAREHRTLQMRIRLESYSQRLLVLLGGGTILIFFLTPVPVSPREGAFEALGRMVLLTAFLVLAWRRAKSKSREIRRELESYLRELGD
jgi:hypothetical protein